MKRWLLYVTIFVLLPWSGCSQDQEDASVTHTSEGTGSKLFGQQQKLGELNSSAIEEASGIAVSRRYKDALWVHNDSGNEAVLFLISNEAEVLKKVVLEGIENRDWEDMAIGTGPDDKQHYLYLGDIGDNLRLRSEKTIYRFVEPEIALDEPAIVDTVRQFDVFNFEYADGRADAEALMVDPLNKDLYIVSKTNAAPALYRLPYQESPTEELLTAEKLGTVNLDASGLLGLVTAADISADGSEILVKTYGKIFYWKRNRSEAIADVLQEAPEILAYQPEPQGEAIAFTEDQEGFYTLSEKKFGQTPVLYFYPRP